MPNDLFEVEKSAVASEELLVRVPMRKRALNFAQHAWRPAASVMAVALAVLLVWHGVNGKNGILIWQQKRVEDRQLRKEIDELSRENAHLRNRVERLKTSPDAIGVVARDKLHYAKPNEVIVNLPPEQQTQPVAAAK